MQHVASYFGIRVLLLQTFAGIVIIISSFTCIPTRNSPK